jgi:hypothetical protein
VISSAQRDCPRDPVHHVQVADHEAPLGDAEVFVGDQCVCVSFHLRSGHTRPSARPELVESVFALEDVGPQERIRATIPLGEVDLLNALGHHCSSMQARAAGSTCLVDGVLTHCDRCDSAGHDAALSSAD